MTTRVAAVSWGVPLYINARTGGSPKSGAINRDLAIAVRETGLAIATGSMSPYLKDPSTADTFTPMRRLNPDGFVMANLNPALTACDLQITGSLRAFLDHPPRPKGERR
ncbi:hypothetical protein OG389_00065 [Streptomyces sp. NBC_00435]|uniref:hypothetical protein n=1 Tax=Streptomyces sp. NBC_00435 TaxID=2903649 RepID=UPI002E250EE5